jgi:hypothetical protein
VAPPHDQRAGDEQIGLVDDALALQQHRSVVDAAARNIDHFVLDERPGHFEALLSDRKTDTRPDRGHQDQSEQDIADDHQRMAGAARAPARIRDHVGLQRGARATR